jgi:Cu2+-exporting ATPase
MNDNSKMQQGSQGMKGQNHHGMMIADLKKRFYVVLILTVPILLLSTMIQRFIGLNWQFRGAPYLLFALSSIVFVYGGWPFLTGLVDEVKAKNPGMMFLIGFAITVAYGYSTAIVFGLQGMDFFLGAGYADSYYAFRTLDRNEIGSRGFERTGIISSVNAR